MVQALLLFANLTFIGSQATQTQPSFTQDELRKMFVGNARVDFEGENMVVTSNGIPNHETGHFPNRSNPNSIREQHLRFVIPIHPKRADQATRTPFGPIGVAINGIPFYNQYNAEGGDAVRLEVFDSCCGHPDPMGMYHYHKFPECVHNPFESEPGKHSSLIGFMFDGYAVYAPNGENGKPPTDLDECNGHWDAARGYHYHVTSSYPYIIGAYRGVVNLRIARGRMGPPPR